MCAFRFALEAEKIHARLFRQAQDGARSGKDIELNSIHICPVCGHTVLNEVPDRCPVCGAKKEMYRQF